MQIISKQAVDFEMQPDVLAVEVFEAVIQPMPPKKVERKPENERIWKWWEIWSQTHLQIDTVIQDPNGRQFRVQNTRDWGQADYFHSEITEQPVDL